MRISCWSSDVCSSDLALLEIGLGLRARPCACDIGDDRLTDTLDRIVAEHAGVEQFLEQLKQPHRAARRAHPDRIEISAHAIAIALHRSSPSDIGPAYQGEDHAQGWTDRKGAGKGKSLCVIVHLVVRRILKNNKQS